VVPKILKIEYGASNLRKFEKENFLFSVFKNLNSSFMTFSECNATKYNVNPIMNGNK
tara:strand:- start:835 stop:1005 length:171 start_codon:yes stop_codon:yes gene_type:complete